MMQIIEINNEDDFARLMDEVFGPKQSNILNATQDGPYNNAYDPECASPPPPLRGHNLKQADATPSTSLASVRSRLLMISDDLDDVQDNINNLLNTLNNNN